MTLNYFAIGDHAVVWRMYDARHRDPICHTETPHFAYMACGARNVADSSIERHWAGSYGAIVFGMRWVCNAARDIVVDAVAGD